MNINRKKIGLKWNVADKDKWQEIDQLGKLRLCVQEID